MNAEPKLQTMPEENRATSAEIIPLNICNNKSKTKKCEQCGKEFEVKRKDMRFCSSRCRDRSWRINNSERYRESVRRYQKKAVLNRKMIGFDHLDLTISEDKEIAGSMCEHASKIFWLDRKFGIFQAEGKCPTDYIASKRKNGEKMDIHVDATKALVVSGKKTCIVSDKRKNLKNGLVDIVSSVYLKKLPDDWYAFKVINHDESLNEVTIC